MSSCYTTQDEMNPLVPRLDAREIEGVHFHKIKEIPSAQYLAEKQEERRIRDEEIRAKNAALINQGLAEWEAFKLTPEYAKKKEAFDFRQAMIDRHYEEKY